MVSSNPPWNSASIYKKIPKSVDYKKSCVFPKLVAENFSDFFENFEIFENFRKFSKSWFFDFQRIFTIFEKSWFREFSKIFKNLKFSEKIRKFFDDQLWEHTTFFIINGFWIFFIDQRRISWRIRWDSPKVILKQGEKINLHSVIFWHLTQDSILDVIQFRETTLKEAYRVYSGKGEILGFSDFSLLSMIWKYIFWISELELEIFKICLE